MRTLVAAAVLVLALDLAPAASAGGSPVALVTAETANEVLALSLPGGKILRRVRLHDPQAIAAAPSGPAVVLSPSGTVTLLAWKTLRVLNVFRSLRSPQAAAISPDGRLAYVTDAASGFVGVIDLATRRIVDDVLVGQGAHHLAVSPDGRRLWVALGEDAATIVILDTSNPRAPRVLSRFHPPLAAHDLAFAPDGWTVWVTSAAATTVSVLDAHTAKLVASVPAGPAPQHVAFEVARRPLAFLTSGYGSTIETVDPRTRKVLHRAGTPYGSFDLATAGGIVATSSLLDGEVAEFGGPALPRWLRTKVAPAARDLAITVWP